MARQHKEEHGIPTNHSLSSVDPLSIYFLTRRR